MQLIHFTQPATDPLESSGAASVVSFLPLADGAGDTHLSCVHLKKGGKIEAPSLTHAATILVVHGRITITGENGLTRNLNIHAGMGIVAAPEEPYSFQSDTGAILVLLEAQSLTPHARAISTPQRIAGATWPNDSV